MYQSARGLVVEGATGSEGDTAVYLFGAGCI